MTSDQSLASKRSELNSELLEALGEIDQLIAKVDDPLRSHLDKIKRRVETASQLGSNFCSCAAGSQRICALTGIPLEPL